MKNLHVQVSDDDWDSVKQVAAMFTTKRLIGSMCEYLGKRSHNNKLLVAICLGDFESVDKIIAERFNNADS